MSKMLTKRLYDSFRYAFNGLWFCIKNERNFRVHIFSALTICLISPYYNLSKMEILLTVFVVSLVIICEMFNTAIEAAIDLTVKGYSDLAEKAKDVSAGAVLISAVCAVVFGVFLFLRFDVIHNIFVDLTSSPVKIAAVVIYAAAGYLFVKGTDKV